MTIQIVFFDKHCVFCHRCIEFLLWADKKKVLSFADLSSQTAQRVFGKDFEKIHSLNTIVFKQDKHTWIRSKAMFKILQAMGGVWGFIGKCNVLPSWTLDPIYKLIAHLRLRSTTSLQFDKKDQYRFLP